MISFIIFKLMQNETTCGCRCIRMQEMLFCFSKSVSQCNTECPTIRLTMVVASSFLPIITLDLHEHPLSYSYSQPFLSPPQHALSIFNVTTRRINAPLDRSRTVFFVVVVIFSDSARNATRLNFLRHAKLLH